MGAGVLFQLFNIVAPLVAGVIRKHQATTGTTELPTNEQMAAIFQASLDAGDAEAASWFASHPKV